ncbi:hypothetical protein N0V92_007371 [Colletotrichum tropicale]|nr:hypothetical protein N0V92_007371 [Colletotrichum tropicale]
MVPLCVRLSTDKASFGSKLLRVDGIGGILFIGGMTSFLIGISWAGVQFPWSSAATIAPIIVGAVAVSACLFWEKYGATEPFFRPSLFYSWSAVAVYFGAFCQGFLLFCGLYYIPFYFISVRFVTPTQSGLNLFPVTCLLLPGSIVVSVLTSRLGRFRWAIWSGWALATVGCGLLVLLDENTTTALWAIYFAIFGIGNGMVLTSVNVGTQAISRIEDCGRAACMYAFMRTLGMSVGVAVGGTTFQNVMVNRLRELGLPETIAQNAEAFATELAGMASWDPVRLGTLSAYVKGFQGVFWVMTATAVSGFITSLVIRKHSMDKTLESRFTLEGTRNRKSEVPSVGSYIKELNNIFWSHERPVLQRKVKAGQTKLYALDSTTKEAWEVKNINTFELGSSIKFRRGLQSVNEASNVFGRSKLQARANMCQSNGLGSQGLGQDWFGSYGSNGW